jgi:hypothetical protein
MTERRRTKRLRPEFTVRLRGFDPAGAPLAAAVKQQLPRIVAAINAMGELNR